MAKADTFNFLLFLLAQVFTFTFITLLQFTDFPLFVVMLLLMHVGIALFIISKKRFIKSNRAIKQYYTNVYLLLSLYLPILIYKLLSYLFFYDINVALKTTFTIVITICASIYSIYNSILMHLYLKGQNKDTTSI
jgi:hypothetical protein